MSWNWVHSPEAKKTAVAVGVVSVVALLSYATWRAFVNGGKGGETPTPKKKPVHGRRFLKDQAYWAAINNIKAAASDDIKNGRISKNLLIGINKAMNLLVSDEFLANIVENRKIRRNLLTNIDQYVQELQRGNHRNEKLLEEAEREVVRDLGMDDAFYRQQSKMLYQDDPNIAYMSIFLLENLKSKLETQNKDLRKETLVAYYNIQADNFDKYNFQELGMATDALIACKQSFMADLASLQLRIEEEDLLHNKLLLAEPEVMDANRRLEEKVYEETQKANRFSY
jgi:hypothetical protein